MKVESEQNECERVEEQRGQEAGGNQTRISKKVQRDAPSVIRGDGKLARDTISRRRRLEKLLDRKVVYVFSKRSMYTKDSMSRSKNSHCTGRQRAQGIFASYSYARTPF